MSKTARADARPPSSESAFGTCFRVAIGLVSLAMGLFLLGGGAYLISLGGSWYFATAGLGLAASGVQHLRRSPSGAWLYLLVLIATIAWALWDVGLAFWPLFSRVLALAVIAVPVLLLAAASSNGRLFQKRHAYGSAGTIVIALLATLYAALQPMPIQSADHAPTPIAGKAVGGVESTGWPHWGRTPSGTRHAVLDKITPQNVAGLDVAWTYRTGEVPTGSQGHVVTPLQVGGMLYGCTQSSTLFALDAETGKEVWRFNPKAGANNVYPRCRGVGYHDSASTSGTPAIGSDAQAAACTRRIVATTVDARIVEVDALTGKPCTGFGDNGSVSLRIGMGTANQDLYFPTAAPTVVRNLVVVGGLVWDNQQVGEPSGVVRAFNVLTGELEWAWDLGNPAITKFPPEGQTYTPGTPNVWSTPSFDEELGLIYLPTGNATPDFWGGHRTEADDRYSASIVALDIATGRERWRFQTVHHDRWDYDVPSQPALYDVPDGHGGTAPALIQTTKRGQIFMLDRRNGKPIAAVEERSVPQGGVADDRSSPTQPYSVGMPAIGTEPLSEKRMWGLTPFDQLVCRIGFRQARYEGEFTPPSERKTIQYPSWLGGMNWGSASIAENLGYLIVNDTRVPTTNRMIPRKAYDEASLTNGGHEGNAPQLGTPWGIEQQRFLSPLGIPCQEPPYGTITAIDLSTREVVWSMPLGTTEATGPFGIATYLPIPIGMPTRGGSITTSSGLIFMAGTQDYDLRAIDVRTGRDLWKGRLPVGAETTPMTYVSPSSGRQFVVISAGGNSVTKLKGDYVVAFALPK